MFVYNICMYICMYVRHANFCTACACALVFPAACKGAYAKDVDALLQELSGCQGILGI